MSETKHRYAVRDGVAVFDGVSQQELDTIVESMNGWNQNEDLVKWISNTPDKGRFGNGYIEKLDDHYTISIEQKNNHFLIIMVDNILTGDMK